MLLAVRILPRSTSRLATTVSLITRQASSSTKYVAADERTWFAVEVVESGAEAVCPRRKSVRALIGGRDPLGSRAASGSFPARGLARGESQASRAARE
jgi:hypothetical protein